MQLTSESAIARELKRPLSQVVKARKNGTIKPLGTAGRSFVYDLQELESYRRAILTPRL